MLRFSVLVFVLAAAAFLSAVTTIRIAIRGRIVSMPNVIGQTAPEAQRMLAARGLQLRVADRVYSPMPVNAVVRQSPPSGEEMKISQDAHVVLSLGPQMIKVPGLEGQSMRAARISLLQAGLQLGEVTTIYIPGAQPDIVLKQDPPEGTTATSPHVDLLVSGADRQPFYVMPTVVGMEQQDASRTLTTAGLKITKLNHIAQAGAPKGTIVGQNPPGGERILGDVTVELGVAD
ncbi:MAG TPA: PASTA domain-containing protein [Candidatus Acidoferrales bacterium]|nr:PASTA domain-containing protein [Candidatus Acidoferrales bacterium]